MKVNYLSILKYVLSLGAAVALFAYLYRGQDLGAMFRAMATADPMWLAFSVAISLTSHLARARRWAVMLQPLGYRAHTLTTFSAVMVGYLANLVVPRMGEVSRCAALNKVEKVPVNVSFGAVIAERVIDVVCLLAICIGGAILEADRIGSFINTQLSKSSSGGSDKLMFLLFVGLVGLGLLGVFWLLRRRIAAHPLYLKVREFIFGLRDGVLAVLKLNTWQLTEFIFQTVLLWGCYFFTSYVLFFATSATSGLDLHCALAVLVMSSISMVIPVQGGIGVYHLFITQTLMAYGLAEEEGKYFAFLMHNIQMVVIIGLGLIGLLVAALFSRQTQQASSEA
jgi:uncharacterized membrane protein YbhN (UPF0104 family)